MNYMKIYQQIMHRAKLEKREKYKGVYYERHHIIPDFMFINRKRQGPPGHLHGDPDDKNNLVLLTMREHILAHVLLVKAFHNTKYWASMGSALTLMLPNTQTDCLSINHLHLNRRLPSLSRKYSRFKEIGSLAISAARKGKMPVVDAITREVIGSIEVDHPNVLSGKWVHHSKGRPQNKTPKKLEFEATMKGEGNHNARILNVAYIKEWLLKFSDIAHSHFDGNFIKSKFLEWFDSHQHELGSICVFRNADRIPCEELSRMNGRFLNLYEHVEQLNAERGLGLKFPRYGSGQKYKNIKAPLC